MLPGYRFVDVDVVAPVDRVAVGVIRDGTPIFITISHFVDYVVVIFVVVVVVVGIASVVAVAIVDVLPFDSLVVPCLFCCYFSCCRCCCCCCCFGCFCCRSSCCCIPI